MAWDAVKESLLTELEQRIDSEAENGDRQSLHNLSAALYQRFPQEDLRGRSVENLYGCLHNLLRFVRQWPENGPKIDIYNPELHSHGWDSKYTTLVVLCRGIPFTTASVRGELNRRNLRIHTIASSNLLTRRNGEGELLDVLAADDAVDINAPIEALLFFEISRHADLSELDELRATLLEILGEVSLVVEDFPDMCGRLQDAATAVANSECIDRDYRDEAVAFLGWMERDHMILLGYEYMQAEHGAAGIEIQVKSEVSLGLLRHYNTRGTLDLKADLESLSLSQLHHKQLSFSKSRCRSRVHRVAYPDYVEIREFNEAGEVVGQHRFLGLYTSPAYTMDPRHIPILRRKVERILEMSQLDLAGHERRELVRVIQVYPRNELFQSSVKELCDTLNAVNRIQERRQTRLFIRQDVHGKFVNCVIFIPRDHYNTDQRSRIESILRTAFRAEDLEFTAYYSESILVRGHFVLRVDPAVPLEYDVGDIEQQIVQAMLSWQDRLRLCLVDEFGEEAGERALHELGCGFPPGYRDDFDPRIAVLDIRKIQTLRGGRGLAMSLHRAAGQGDDTLRLRTYHREDSLPLSDALPILENLGLRVVREQPYCIVAGDGEIFWVQEFSLIYSLAEDIDVALVKDEFEDAFSRIWYGEAENDCFNRLLIGTRLGWREIALLRAYARYLRQLNFPYSVEYIGATMANHLHISASIVELFVARFSPVFGGDEVHREERCEALEQGILDSLEEVPNLGEDRIIRQYVRLVKATLRTNFFQQELDGNLKSYFSFKLRPADIPDIPQPIPMYEIFVYSPRVEGVHLRGGKVARGGLRWSDRQEDFRTEVLGLVKAQQVKNAVIVPVGAKGGFVARQLRPDMSRAEMQAEGIACYELFIQALLDITDNRSADGVVHPSQVVVKDEEDPYLVVAADKGTASFSDIANSVSARYGFWLGDAFASGGSAGYDHKEMGITAKGAWVCVQRHFRELGVDIQNTDFSVVGIGDMAGDVFGNGMLLSRHTCLVAAFNHQHIFIDPQPDAATSFEERARLFNLPRSSWADYSAEIISEGGGVFERSLKSISLTPQIKSRFDIDADRVTPGELISHLLRARVDLLWNGGIGTYVKSTTESHQDVGDKSNDGLRVDASELRCQVVGEGGNLGVTQLARVEFGLAGGRSNTDFIDNAGGVDCSDHEVNIKILLNTVVARGDLTEKHRNALLEEMTDAVSSLVLKNSYRQAQAISLVEYQAEERSGEYQRFIEEFEESGRLDRKLEFIPGDEELQERLNQGNTLTRPELSVLVSYSKAALKEQLIDSELEMDACLSDTLSSAFPEQLAQRYPEDIQEHRLHREIVATQLANDIVNRMGLNFVLRQQKATGASTAEVACAYSALLGIYKLPDLWDQLELLDHKVPASTQMELMLSLIRLVKRGTRWLLRNRRRGPSPAAVIEQFRPSIEQLAEALPSLVRGRAAEQYLALNDHYLEQGVNESLAAAVASAPIGYMALGIIEAATDADAPLLDMARLYFAMGETLELDWYSGQMLAAKVSNEWQAMARDTYLDDLDWQQRTLATGALTHMDDDRNLLTCMQRWEEQESLQLARWREMLSKLQAVSAPDFAMLAVANRELLELAQSSIGAAGRAG